MPSPLLGEAVGDAQPATMTRDAQTDSASRVIKIHFHSFHQVSNGIECAAVSVEENLAPGLDCFASLPRASRIGGAIRRARRALTHAALRHRARRADRRLRSAAAGQDDEAGKEAEGKA